MYGMRTAYIAVNLGSSLSPLLKLSFDPSKGFVDYQQVQPFWVLPKLNCGNIPLYMGCTSTMLSRTLYR
jgi:hypothetical protein